MTGHERQDDLRLLTGAEKREHHAEQNRCIGVAVGR
jgi:hypothetical protein